MHCFLLFAACLATQADSNPPELTDNEQQLLEFVLSGFKHSRLQLRSGAYRAFGRKGDGIAGNERFPAYEGDVEIYSAFDYDAGLFRFDRSEPNLFDDAPDLPVRRVHLRLKYVRTPELSLHAAFGWFKWDKGDVRIKPPDAAPIAELYPLDVRNLGAGLLYTVRRGTPFEEAFEALKSRRVTEIVEESQGVIRFTQVYNETGNPKSIYWFDKTQGFSPIRAEFLERAEDGHWRPPSTLTRVTWTQINDVWVPETVSVVDQQGGARRRESYDLRFEWESVNRPIASDVFTRESLQLKTGTVIIDRRLGKSIIVGRVGEEPRPSAEPGSMSGRARNIFIFANITIVLVVAIILLYRRSTRSRTTS